MSPPRVSAPPRQVASAQTVALNPPEWDGVPLPKRVLWFTQGFVFRHRDAFLVCALTTIALVLRMWINRGLWLDEATSVAQAKMEFGRMLSYLRTSDLHPPLYQVILWSDIRLFGDGPLSIRMPSVLLGTATVPLLYGAGRELFNRRVGLIAALFGTVGPAAVWYSQEARVYALFIALATVALWAQVCCIRRGTFKAWVVYSLASVALIWSHYFAAIYVLTQQLAFLVLIWGQRGSPQGRRLLAGWVRSVGGIAVLLIPLLVITYGQLDRQIEFGGGFLPAQTAEPQSPVYSILSSIASALLGYHSDSTMLKINALWPLGMLGALLALGRGRSQSAKLLVALIVVPTAVLLVVSFKREDVLELRYFAGAIPALTLLLARGISVVTRRALTTGIACVAVVAIMTAGLVGEQLSKSNPRVYDFDTTLTAFNADQRPGDVMLLEPYYLYPTVRYYAPRYDSRPLTAGLESTTAPGRILIVDSLAFADHEISRSRVRTVIDRLLLERKLVQHVEGKHIEVWVFS